MFYVSDLITTSPEAFDTALQMFVYERFSAEGIPFERVDIVKTIFLCNRQQTEFYLYVTSHDKPFVTRDFCGALGIPRVSFASSPWFACTDGTPTCFVKLRTRDLLDKYLRGREVRLI